MAKECETFDHTADVGLLARADSPRELFEALAEGLADFICPRTSVRPAARREVRVQAEDIEALAVDFLGAVLNEIQTEHFVVARVEAEEVTDRAAAARLIGEPYDPARHEIHTEVKAVTYHLLKVAPEAGRWVGRIVLDL